MGMYMIPVQTCLSNCACDCFMLTLKVPQHAHEITTLPVCAAIDAVQHAHMVMPPDQGRLEMRSMLMWVDQQRPVKQMLLVALARRCTST